MISVTRVHQWYWCRFTSTHISSVGVVLDGHVAGLPKLGRAGIVTVMATRSPLSGVLPTDPGVSTVSFCTSYTEYKHTVVGMGARGFVVRLLQLALGGVAVDGVFEAVTRDRVAALQRSMAQPPTGIVTPELWDEFEARDFPFVGQRASVLRVGDSGTEVLSVQRVLGVAPTGVYDHDTREAVKAAQAHAGLASTGVVASRTWSLLDRLSA